MVALIVGQTTDFRGGPSETNIDRIQFTVPAVATFSPNQFGPGLISNSVTITGDGNAQMIIIQASAGSANFSAAGWQFEDWGVTDDLGFFSDPGVNNTITGSIQVDTFNTAGGRDVLDGGGGDDSFQVGNQAFLAGSSFTGGGGHDFIKIISSADLRPIAIDTIEELVLFNEDVTAIVSGAEFGVGGITRVTANDGHTVALDVRGNAVDLTGVSFVDWGAGAISIQGTSAVTNTLVGSAQKDVITGSGNSIDFMAGRAGADTLNGGGGSDGFRYFSGSDAVAGEVVNGGTGSDTILLVNAGPIDFRPVTLSSIEALRFLSGTSTATLPGDEIGAGEILTVLGSASADSLIVTAEGQLVSLAAVTFSQWSDAFDSISILGSDLQDFLTGSSKNDFIDGGALADLMVGGLGDDLYEVDVSNDGIIENADAGIDTVLLNGPAYTLPQNVETLLIQGSTGAAGTGNALQNLLQGGSGNDTLSGLGGSDSLAGGGGNDTYINPKNDLIGEAADGGTDTVLSNASISLAGFNNVERIELTGNAAINANGNDLANVLVGNAAANNLAGGLGADTLHGGGGKDVLIGGRGNDTMNGGSEADTFRFAAANTGTDRIRGFETGIDRFDLAGGTFSKRSEAGGNTTLTHGGGTIVMEGVTGLSLVQWNALVLPAGGTAREGARPDQGYADQAADYAGLLAALRLDLAGFDPGLFVYA